MNLGREKRRRALPVLLAALMVVAWLALPDAQAESAVPSASAAPDQQTQTIITLFLNSHEIETMLPGDTISYRFTPASDNDYIFLSFPQADELPATSVRLIRESDGEELAASSQTGRFRFSNRLTAGETYRLDILCESAGSMAVEVMPDARGRCFDNPIALPDSSIRYAKTIVHPRDTHWFSFTAPVSGLYSIHTEQAGSSILDTRGYLMDAEGNTLAMNDDILFPGDANFMIQAELTAGETYFIRISAFSNLTGAYRLAVAMPEEGQLVPEKVTLSPHDLMLDVDQEYTLDSQLQPTVSLPELVYASSNPSVVTVTPDGTLRAIAAGEATVWAYAMGGVSDSCKVTVRPVEVTGMWLHEDEVSLYAGEQLKLTPQFEPANASNQAARYESSDETVFSVDSNGWITGLSEGEAVLTVISMDGSFTDTLTVHVPGARPSSKILLFH